MLQTILYPPILSATSPAFIRDNARGCRIYFSISSYNAASEIKYVQVAIRSQKTNLSVLNREKYPCEVKVMEKQKDGEKYYITIEKEDMINNIFEINQYYKIQLRFVGAEATDISLLPPQQIASWLDTNKTKFSEWSKVTLTKPISNPTLSLYTYNLDNTITTLSKINGIITGNLTLEEENDNEILNTYKVFLIKDNVIIEESELLSTNIFEDPNKFNYTFSYNLLPDTQYTIKVKYSTNNGYEAEEVQNFTTQEEDPSLATDFSIAAKVDNENARIILELKRYTKTIFNGRIVIRRTDSKTNFTVWEDFITRDYSNVTNVKEQLYDITAESGIWYKYAVQVITDVARGPQKGIKSPISLYLDNMFLVSNGRSLKLTFDSNISTFNQTTSASKIDTIGSQFPIMKRNGNMNYATFTINALISSEMDEENIFITREKLYGNKDIESLYNNYNSTNEIKRNQDFTLERLYRKEVLSFLNSGQAFLLKTNSEGNYLIRLMGVTMTPNTVLGRRLYSFNTNATEIAESNIDNYKLYKII